jgi:hypothetical protein
MPLRQLALIRDADGRLLAAAAKRYSFWRML